MNIAETPQNIIRKKAISVFVIVLLLTVIQILLFYFKIDRISTSVINMLIFWPLFLVALGHSILVVVYSIRHFKAIQIVYLIFTLPVFAFLIYFIWDLIVKY